MKQTDFYETPKVEIISIELRSVLNASESEPDFSGNVMDFTRGEGEW